MKNKPKKDRGYWTWKSRTCPMCKKRFPTKQRMETHHAAEHQPQPPNMNLIAGETTQAMEYSAQKHVSDLQRTNRRLREVAVKMISTVAEIAMRQLQ